MKRFLTLMLLLASTTATASQCAYRSEFNDYQWENIRTVYIAGWYTGFKWSLAAITIVETSAGLDKENERTKDYGLMQNNIKTAKKRLKAWQDAGRDFGEYDITKDDDVRRLLLENHDISIALAVEELRFWKRVRNGNWHEIYASYNGGYYKGQSWENWSLHYTDKVITALSKIQQCESLLNRGL
ncbi:hypothetical protein MYOV011v1_p0288 [Vibrio phage 6E35.1a]|nr:hypothetical protein MYOV011v1_p0288 [Vibrio phage 6E35.1a]